MGIDYSHSAGYGIVFSLEDDDDFRELALNSGYVGYGYETPEDWATAPEEEIDIDEYEILEHICKKYGLEFAVAGSSYSGKLCYLVGKVTSDYNFWFTEVEGFSSIESTNELIDKLNVEGFSSIESTDELIDKLNGLIQDLGLDKKIGYYSGIHQY